LGMLVLTLGPRNLPEPEHAKASNQGSGACSGLRLPIDRKPKPSPRLLLAYDASQGLGIRRHAPSHRGSGAIGIS
jgi:hypothetical protein